MRSDLRWVFLTIVACFQLAALGHADDTQPGNVLQRWYFAKPPIQTPDVALARYLIDKGAHTTYIGRGRLGHLALARWAGWSAGQVGRHVKCR